MLSIYQLKLCSLESSSHLTAQKSLLDLSGLGLRTLCVAHKVISKAEALEWLSSYKEAASSLQDRAEKLDNVAENLEKGMQLLGITAIEDRLQDEVPECIEDFKRAGIVVWMLTGDKEETAVNIGHSCNLLANDTKTFYISKINSAQEYHDKLEEIYNKVFANYVKGVGYSEGPSFIPPVDIALVMDGPSFLYFDENNESHRKWFG